MPYRTVTEAAIHFTQRTGEKVTRRQVVRWLERGYFKDVKKISWGNSRGVWFIGDDLPPDPSVVPIPRRQPPGPRQRSQIPNAVITRKG